MKTLLAIHWVSAIIGVAISFWAHFEKLDSIYSYLGYGILLVSALVWGFIVNDPKFGDLEYMVFYPFRSEGPDGRKSSLLFLSVRRAMFVGELSSVGFFTSSITTNLFGWPAVFAVSIFMLFLGIIAWNAICFILTAPRFIRD
jgi:drug/metabolite transporter (DMT)-like permease